MFRCTDDSGRLNSRRAKRKVNATPKDFKAIGMADCWKLDPIAPSARPGFMAISEREIASAPMSCIPDPAMYSKLGFPVGVSPMSPCPVMKPQGEVPRTPSERIEA